MCKSNDDCNDLEIELSPIGDYKQLPPNLKDRCLLCADTSCSWCVCTTCSSDCYKCNFFTDLHYPSLDIDGDGMIDAFNPDDADAFNVDAIDACITDITIDFNANGGCKNTENKFGRSGDSHKGEQNDNRH